MRSGEEEAFIKAFDAHADSLFRHAFFRISDRERARDLTQDAFLKTWDYIANGGIIKQHKSFLYRVLHNLIIDEYRKKHDRSLDEMLENESTAHATEVRLSEGDVREAEEKLDLKILSEKVVATLPRLPDNYRQVLTLRFVDGFSISEIAETVGVSENVVSVRIHRGVAKLKTLCES
ncbi:MAG: RNA polymerase sigma factor [Patescibacteria group bacterium]|nr:RNA polymerase sigma factor [bacterium]MDZ4226917.1 RNA polymerase sigma factor [Patescibacteria group bacterium]